jgi:phenylpropionate dioxygenase-like ring-hydroxylating dioxygenase large terminal subunit
VAIIEREPIDPAETAVGEPPEQPTLIPAARYTDPAFFALEHERLWPSVWQVACSVDHVSTAGDWFELRCGPLSVLIVRGDDGGLRAFQNVCRHRGNSLCQGAGAGLTELRCPFHRWAWDLRGQLREVPSRRGFGAFRNEDLPLLPVRVGEWGPLVFVSLDPDAVPLEDWLEGVPADAAWARLDEFRCVATTRTPVPCNWKAVADGFSETYHVQGLHPEMLASIDDVHAPQRFWGRHAVSYQRYAVPSPRLGPDVTEQDVWDSFIVTQGGRMGPAYAEPCPMPPVPEGEGVRDVIAALLREHQRQFGADMSDFDTDAMLGLAQYNLFPNVTVLLWSEMVNVLIARPGPAVDQAELVSFLLLRHTADAPRTPPPEFEVATDGDLGWVLNQDVSILRTIQAGLRQPGLTHLVLSNEERRIINMHRNLEAALGILEDGATGSR